MPLKEKKKKEDEKVRKAIENYRMNLAKDKRIIIEYLRKLADAEEDYLKNCLEKWRIKCP